MRFSNTLLLALSAVAVQSAVVPTQETTTQAVTQAQPTPQLTAEGKDNETIKYNRIFKI